MGALPPIIVGAWSIGDKATAAIGVLLLLTDVTLLLTDITLLLTDKTLTDVHRCNF